MATVNIVITNTTVRTITDADTNELAVGAAVYNFNIRANSVAGSVVVKVPDDAGGFITLEDDGLGALAEVGGAGTGTVNNTTGAIQINNNLSSATVGTAGTILVSYRYSDPADVIKIPGQTGRGIEIANPGNKTLTVNPDRVPRSNNGKPIVISELEALVDAKRASVVIGGLTTPTNLWDAFEAAATKALNAVT
jgi:hypothetical protein